MKTDYIPRKENDLLAWHDKFKAGTTAHGTALGLTAPNLASITDDNEDLHADIGASVTADAAAQSATAAKRATVKRVVAASRTYAQHMKTAPAYSDVLGQTMGIEGAADTTDLANSKPTLTCLAKGGGAVEIAFDKSTSDGVNIYCLRPGDTAPVFLARDTYSPYVDNRPLLVPGKPEIREYRATYVLTDEEIGASSDEALVTATP
jgi:hypothetical protein